MKEIYSNLNYTHTNYLSPDNEMIDALNKIDNEFRNAVMDITTKVGLKNAINKTIENFKNSNTNNLFKDKNGNFISTDKVMVLFEFIGGNVNVYFVEKINCSITIHENKNYIKIKN